MRRFLKLQWMMVGVACAAILCWGIRPAFVKAMQGHRDFCQLHAANHANLAKESMMMANSLRARHPALAAQLDTRGFPRGEE